MGKAMPKPRASGEVLLPIDDGETYVYRSYCRCGDLLYVGIAWNLPQRLAGHYRDRAEWLRRATRIEWDLYPSRSIAELVEARLIRELDPSHNTAGKSRAHRRQRWQDLPWPAFLDPGETPERRRLHRARQLSIGDRL